MMVRILSGLLLTVFLSCKNQSDNNLRSDTAQMKFDIEKWNERDEKTYLYRDRMLKDVVYNILQHGMQRDSVIKLLGRPTRTDSLYLFYTIDRKDFKNILTLHTKSLVIKFKNDSSLEWRKIKD